MADLRGLPNLYKDWFVTSAFYSAIHSVMARLQDTLANYDHDAGEPRIPSRGPRRRRLKGHLHRKEMVRRHLQKLFKDYNHLETLSLSARYHELDMAFLTSADLGKVENIVDNSFLPL